MKVKRKPHHARRPKQRAKAAPSRKPQPKVQVAYYARETLSGGRLIRQGVGNSLAKAPVLE